MSSTFITVIITAVVVGAITAFVLYRASHIKKEVILGVPKEKFVEETPIIESVREKVEHIAVKTEHPERVAREISQIIQQETEQRVNEVKQEYAVKYQVLTQEKNKELEGARQEYHTVKQSYDRVEKLYKKTDSEKKQTEAVVKSIAEGLVVVNAKGEVLLMNPAAEKLLGSKSEKKAGRPITEGMPDELLISLSKDSGQGEKTIEIQAKDENVKKILRQSSAVIQNEDGQTVGMVNILTDVTKQRELDGIKAKFVSNVTHELRTPIVAMEKAMSLITSQAAGPLTPDQLNFMNIVARNLTHLSRLVEDLLDIAKIDAGKMRIKMEPSRLDKVIHDACDSLDMWAKSKGIKMEREVEKNMPEIAFDPGKISQVLNNLIGNAIKFTPRDGKIALKTSWSADGSMAQVSVSDTGVGIAKENLPKLFGRFEQFGDKQGISGTGLGLSITKEIVDRHGGKIRVESEEGKGSTFTFELPVKQTRLEGHY